MTHLVLVAAALAQAYALSGWESAWAGVLQCLSLSVLFRHCWNAKSTKQAAFRAWLFATVWLFASFEWISTSLSRYGDMPLVISWLAVFVLAAALSVYHAAAMAVAHASCRKWHHITQAIAVGSAWTLAELARSAWFTGFPWASPGYAHMDSGLAVWSPMVGVMGLTWISSVLAAFMAWLQRSATTGLLQSAAAHVILIVLLLWPVQEPSLGTPSMAQTVTLLQANVDPLDKFKNEGRDEFNWYLQQIRSSSSDLTLAPETAIATIGGLEDFKAATAPLDLDPLKAHLIGAMEGINGGYANAAWAKMQGQWVRYHKTHLVPFGEYTPSLFEWFVKWANIPYSDFRSGANTINPFVHHQHAYAMSICYEDVFGDEMARLFVQGPRVPTALVNISNLAWFGEGRALDQHLVIGRMRALELRRPMLMSTNTGWSAVIDDSGKVIARMPKSQRGTMSVSYQGVQSEPSLYAQWAGRWGHLPLWWLCALGLALPLVGARMHSINRSGKAGRPR